MRLIFKGDMNAIKKKSFLLYNLGFKIRIAFAKREDCTIWTLLYFGHINWFIYNRDGTS